MDITNLEEGTRREDAVVVGLVESAAYPGNLRIIQMQQRCRGAAEFRSKIAAFDLKLLHDGRRDPNAAVQFLENVVVNQRDLDVLIAAAFAGTRIHVPEKVEVRTIS